MYGYYGYGYGYGRGFGFGRRGRGRGRGFGRGFGYGATLGYCPWTGMPRGWRWTYPYGVPYSSYGGYGNYPLLAPRAYAPYGQYYPYGQNQQQYQVDEKTALQDEAKFLEERLNEIEARLKELKR